MTLPRPAFGGNTRSVTPGIETHEIEDRIWDWSDEPGVYAGLDWLRVTACDRFRPLMKRFLHSWFGEVERESQGAKFFRSGEEWVPGVQLSWGHSADICMLDVRGERFTSLGGSEGIRLVNELMNIGFPIKPTRIDIAIDYVRQGQEICANALASCERGELCGLRRWSRDDEHTASGRMTRKLVKLGKRESAVCARIYDKGRQQGLPKPGVWERLEVEFKDDRAPQVMESLADSGPNWITTLRGLLFGAFDFKIANGRTELHRRPRSFWWSKLMGESEPTPVPPDPEPRSTQKWLTGLERAYGGMIKHAAAELGMPVGELIEQILAHVTPRCSRPELVPGLRTLGFGPAQTDGPTQNRPARH